MEKIYKKKFIPNISHSGALLCFPVYYFSSNENSANIYKRATTWIETNIEKIDVKDVRVKNYYYGNLFMDRGKVIVYFTLKNLIYE